MANTRLSNPVMVTANNDVKPSNVNVTPANGSDGKYTWACVGQKDSGSTSVITFSVNCQASNPQLAPGTTDHVYATCQQKAATTNYVQVTASYVAPSNSTNWTISIGGVGSGNYVRFVRGTGGGSTRRPSAKTSVKAATVLSAKKAVKKAAKKKVAKPAAKKAVKKAVKKAARKAARPAAKKAAKTARKARGK